MVDAPAAPRFHEANKSGICPFLRRTPTMNRTHASYAGILHVSCLIAFCSVPLAAKGKTLADYSLRAVRSFYDLPDAANVITTFPSGTGAIIRHFQKRGITLKPLPSQGGRTSYRFVGQAQVVSHRLHGTADAPLSGTRFTVQHRAGISMTFQKPQAVVAMKELASLSPAHLPVLRGIDAQGDPEVKWRLGPVIKTLEAKRINLTPDGRAE